MASLSSDLCYDILKRLDGATLASAACTCAAFCSISREERLWENVCCSMWPSTNRDDVKNLISSLGGFKKFYADCFPLIVNKEVPEFHWKDYYEYPQEWTEAEYYGDEDEAESISPSDFVSIVDIRYKDKTICSRVLWGIPNANGFNGWFYNCPFRVDLLAYSAINDDQADEVTVSLSDGLPPIWSMERRGKMERSGKSCAMASGLAGFLLTKKQRKLLIFPVGALLEDKDIGPENDFLLRFGSVLPAKDILPCQVVECILIMKFRVARIEDEDTHTTLKLTELSMQLGDMEGSHVNGRNSLLVLREALSCPRSKNYSEASSRANCTQKFRASSRRRR
ncbi:F-box protein SNE [Sesamum angolense]|uniref:F-box protein SNE n=1 Tax=Sesamum angolense TaxID=2727404 RepID=A0AAE2C2Y6_9LAMI|nr:F-box protein SNE [Sesamum angolense]